MAQQPTELEHDYYTAVIHHPARRRNRPSLTDKLKDELAAKIAEMAGRGMSDPQIGREIGLSDTQVRKVRAHAGIEPGRAPRHTYNAAKGTVVACPRCHTAVTVERNGRLEAHKYLGPTRRGVVMAVWCRGEKENQNA